MNSEFGDFDAREVEPSTGGSRGPIPAGTYRSMIVKADWKKTKNGKGKYLELIFEVVVGEHKGSRVWARLNLQNQSDVAVKIAKSELSAICHAIGIMVPNQSAQLLNIPMVIGVSMKERDDKPGSYGNEVIRYESIEAAAKREADAGCQPSPVDTVDDYGPTDDDAPF